LLGISRNIVRAKLTKIGLLAGGPRRRADAGAHQSDIVR
jgi:hypothetical protein